MAELIEVKNLTFTYPEQENPALTDIHLTLNSGDFLTLVGATGSGKTTLLKQLKRELIPAGTIGGQVQYLGQSVAQLDSVVSAQQIGFVAQDPQTQPIMATVMEELTFPLENLGYSSEVINNRVAELANFLGLDKLLTRAIKSLSGGQVQLVNLASVLALKPQIILLDEPTAQLDPTTAQNFLNVLRQVHDELGITIVLTEHRLSRVLSLANRLVILQKGHLIYDGGVSNGLRKMALIPELAAFVPPIPDFFLRQKIAVDKLPLSIPAGRQEILKKQYYFSRCFKEKNSLDKELPKILTARKLMLDFDQKVVLRQLDLTITQGEWLAIIGKNGSGKSTLLSVLAGLLKSQHGRVKLNQKIIWKIPNLERIQTVAYLSQNPTEQFSGMTVIEELRAQNKLGQLPMSEEDLNHLLVALKLRSVSEHNVFDLSGGQQQLLGLGLALVTRPKVLLLDEPTKGLDPNTKQQFAKILQRVHQKGTAIVMASHDMDFCAQYAEKCTFMFNGQVNPPVTSRKFFTQNFLFTTAINRLLTDQVPDALFCEDVQRKDTLKGGEEYDDARNQLA